MRQAADTGTQTVVGPDGRAMTIHDLPPPNTTRWVVRRKAQVVFGVQGLDEATFEGFGGGENTAGVAPL